MEHNTSNQPLTQEMLLHISRCDACAEKFADYIELNAHISAPRDLSQSILNRSKGLDIQMIETSHRVSKQIQLLFYSLKVTAAVAGALILLALSPNISATEFHPDFVPSLYQQAEQATNRLNHASTPSYHSEVSHYDKKEK